MPPFTPARHATLTLAFRFCIPSYPDKFDFHRDEPDTPRSPSTRHPLQPPTLGPELDFVLNELEARGDVTLRRSGPPDAKGTPRPIAAVSLGSAAG
jgi:hypothetical protein